MFTFCPGFEAAALKIPSGDTEDVTKKQIIGFAKFRTVEEAMQARDVLCGRKVDAERGCALKAEMAKKNLHTKRGISSGEAAKLYALNSSFRRRASVPDPVGIDQSSFYKANSTGDYAQSFDQSSSYSQEFFPQSSIAPSSYTNQLIDIATSADIFDPFAPSNPALDADLINNTGSGDPFYSTDPLSPTNAEETFESKLPPLFGTSQPSSRGFSSVLFNSDTLLSKSLGSMAISDYQDNYSSRSSSFSYSPSIHPGADQNPPCNTLYVGNLPNDSCEDELRQLFQCCPGYKRLSFKTRSNGPMCFVEFENVHYATQALFQLYGNYLSNSTKGGIRLSYSKNPLGVRQVTSTPYINTTDMGDSQSYTNEPFPTQAWPCNEAPPLTARVSLSPFNDSFIEKHLVVKPGQPIKIGRKVSSKTAPEIGNGYFDAKVLSRVHGEISVEKDAVCVAFLNRERLSEEGKLSALHQLRSGDTLDFGVDIKDDEGKVLYNKVSCKVLIHFDSPTNGSADTSAGRAIKISDAEELIAMLESDKTMSADAVEALDKIKISFQTLEKNISTVKKKQDQIVPEPTELQKTVADLNARLSSLHNAMEQQKADILSIKESSVIPQEALKSATSLFETRQHDTRKLLAALEDQVKLMDLVGCFGLTVQGLAAKVAELNRSFETRLTERMDSLEATVQVLKQESDIDKTENARLKDILAELRKDFLELSTKYQTEADQLQPLGLEIASLSKKFESLLKERSTTPSRTPRSSVVLPDDKQASEGPSLFVVWRCPLTL
ncbi:hypothetical protein HDU91_000730 [Kappamyces sp. JEL0680]|nr:hypothetical protein HDU91_000730 [Kappamyces sp. JEL0680]